MRSRRPRLSSSPWWRRCGSRWRAGSPCDAAGRHASWPDTTARHLEQTQRSSTFQFSFIL
eukprot:15240554-Alexandrium_andersonii.AAC.1